MNLVVKPGTPVEMTYVGFETVQLDGTYTRETGSRELCVVVVEGRADLNEWTGLGRDTPWSGPPDAIYLPPGSALAAAGTAELALCWAPAPNGGARARRLPIGEVETRGSGA